MVTYSAFLLKDRAKDWWKALQRRHPKKVSWADFRREFSEKFYPKSYKDARVEEFFRLEQSSMSVADYERRFSELIRAVPYIADNEEEKANRYGQEGHFMKNCPQAEPAITSKPETRSTATGQTSGGRGQQRGGFQFRGSSNLGQPSRGTGRSGPPRGQPGRPRQARVFAVT
ncbi:hypothetical protein JRO89_XS06G0263100 [Xanthoceras sorbifolium]|uniref:Retrotransposon gag domain-containing protein n=1 Tax=Xanthoceras sorbifolium TaxID=99658 RepID=A0ABQ8HZH3_9ROSI|nr:hypothetical protein JRO89_XS06G0263100 [Xanthoceras sorbifolium]